MNHFNNNQAVFKRQSPGANPVPGFPSRSASAAAGADGSATSQAEAAGAGHVAVEAAVVLEGAALEAARAAGEVVGPAAAGAAVPVARPDVGAGGEAEGGGSPPSEPSEVSAAGPRITAALARVSPLEVEVLARPAVPISWPAHFFSSFFCDIQNCFIK
ncbi:hypothetical protein TIFTF001_019203 [Ficus carica]|uniref:Uncharacterized protein n=1 Tax=Ficus carica TaxID=3494 RepID=A0AA88AQ21_FICCA|nr:hypothetical protein TIFTF001_019203 [Ficus carica]